MKLILAVSGGIDSMYMAERASELFPEASFAIAHCNFGLRGAESDGDEAFVRAWGIRHSTEVHVRRFETVAFAEAEGKSIEMAARDLRYMWFAELCRDYGYDAVAVAHNANDNAETLMLNLIRGTGSRGLRGMSPDSLRDGVRIVRPLLGITREEIRGWMLDNAKEWREDSSNAGNDYKRNKIRNQVFPVFREMNPSFVTTLCEDIERFSKVDDIAEDYFRGCGLDPENIDIGGLMQSRHWQYLLFRLTEGRLNSSEFRSLCGCLESGRQISGRRFGPYVAGNGRLVLHKPDNVDWSWELVPREDITCLKQAPGSLLLDAELVDLPPVARHWENGDWMIPFGMKGRKKLSDIFTDLKYTLPQKESALVIPYPGDGSGRVAALIGERIDDSLKITEKTTLVLKIQSSRFTRCSE